MAEVERESMEVDVLFVGAGPGTLAAALHLMKSVEAHNANAAKHGGKTDRAAERARDREGRRRLGDHSLSGAVMNPKAIHELMPDFVEQGFPTEYVCDDASFYMFFRTGTIKSPICPPNFQKKGYHVASLSNVVKWLGEKCEAAGIDIYPGFAARPDPDRGRARRRRAHRRHGRRQARQAEGELPAGHGHLRQGHGARRRRARHAHEAADRALRPRRAESADLRDGRQGDLARSSRRSTCPGRVVHGIAVSRDPDARSTACGSTT